MVNRTTAVTEVMRFCARGVDPTELRLGVLDRLAAGISFDGAFFALTDPATLLYTSAVRREMPDGASSAFIRAEFGADDVNQLRHLARAAVPVGWLDQVTRGERTASARFREAMAPFGLGDELRVALRAGGQCWGLLCLHRAARGTGFERRDAEVLRQVAPHLAAGLRRTVASQRVSAGHEDGPGVVMLAGDGSVSASTPAGARWLAELAELDRPASGALPMVVRSLVQELQGSTGSVAPTARVQLRGGQWLVVHGAYLNDAADRSVAVVVEPASPAVLAPLIVAALGLTRREAQVCQRLLVGSPRKTIASELRLSLHTVNDHVKAIFDKTGTSSAGQLRMRVFADHFAPR